MKTTVAIILAAGRGRRLGGVLPKPLVSLGRESILDRQVRQLRAVGIDRIVVVTGHGAAAVARWAAPRGEVRLVHNPNYATQGNAASLLAALPTVAGAAWVKLDGDLVLLDDALLASFLDSARPGLNVAVDPTAELDDEAMKVRTHGRRIRAFGKHLPDGEAETLGLEASDLALEGALRHALAADPHCYYEAGYQRAVEQGGEVFAHPVSHRWVEVDTPDDLRRARRLVGAR